MNGRPELDVHRGPDRIRPDPSRVVTLLFVPGQEGFDHQDSRASLVLERLLALDRTEVARAYGDVVHRFSGRHRDLDRTLMAHADRLADRLDPDLMISHTHRLLIGATFTSEYAIEGAALCNPSIVPDPDQTGAPSGSLRFIMSVRGIGEGHRSSIGFRTGTIDPDGRVVNDPAPRHAVVGATDESILDAEVVRREIRRLGGGESTDFVLDALGDRFSPTELDEQLRRLEQQVATRSHAITVIPLIRRFTQRAYRTTFSSRTAISERVLYPAMAAESNGMEDARFVRFVDTDGSVRFHATYTAYDGDAIHQQLLTTTDFLTFTSTPMVGPAAANKGLALFPRRINGRFAALSRADRETNALAFSDSLQQWDRATCIQRPDRPWELLQLGNCGSPIETADGWLVLTHGVGPMRTYSIGALLLDLDDPTRVIGQLKDPLISPNRDEQDGYVPNVVYSCGALVHADTLVVPYGIGDSSIGVATIGLNTLLDRLRTRSG